MIPEQIKKFIEVFSRLPAIGPRLATRLAFYLVTTDKNELKNLESAMGGLAKLGRCSKCFFISPGEVCGICSAKNRDKNKIAIVEKETDVLSIEKTGQFNGRYLILGELPKRGVLDATHKLRLERLKNRIHEDGGKIQEIIIALNPTTFGDFTAQIISQEFKDLAGKITRLGRGIPTGGEIEFADEETLRSAFHHRS